MSDHDPIRDGIPTIRHDEVPTFIQNPAPELRHEDVFPVAVAVQELPFAAPLLLAVFHPITGRVALVRSFRDEGNLLLLIKSLLGHLIDFVERHPLLVNAVQAALWLARLPVGVIEEIPGRDRLEIQPVHPVVVLSPEDLDAVADPDDEAHPGRIGEDRRHVRVARATPVFERLTPELCLELLLRIPRDRRVDVEIVRALHQRPAHDGLRLHGGREGLIEDNGVLPVLLGRVFLDLVFMRFPEPIPAIAPDARRLVCFPHALHGVIDQVPVRHAVGLVLHLARELFELVGRQTLQFQDHVRDIVLSHSESHRCLLTAGTGRLGLPAFGRTA